MHINNNEACFIYVTGLVDLSLLQRDFIKPVLSMSIEDLKNKTKVLNIEGYSIELMYNSEEIFESLLDGNAIFICEGLSYAISSKMTKYEKRNIDIPEIEKNLRGPHEGFIESLSTNMSILRRRVKNHSLKFKELKVGNTTNQKVAIAYIDELANKKMLNTLIKKISEINFDGLLAVGYIEQAITQFPNSPFPQYQVTERPDKVVAALLEGRLTIMLDGTPVALIAPVTFFAFLQALDDYSTYWMHGTFLRILRLLALVGSLLLPAIYVAVTTFHYYAIPLNLLVPLAESRAKVPFPPLVEVLILEITVEMMREASVRLPTFIGISISVVAGLIIGQAAVEAGVVSNVLIVVVAFSAVASYVIPSYDMVFALRIIKFLFILSAGIIGIIGVVGCLGLTFAHLVTLESLGQPYFKPLSPFRKSDVKDVLIRPRLKYLRKRPLNPKPYFKNRGKGNG